MFPSAVEDMGTVTGAGLVDRFLESKETMVDYKFMVYISSYLSASFPELYVGNRMVQPRTKMQRKNQD